MKFIFASDSFKGTLSSQDTISLLTKAAKEVFENCDICGVPIADGGEGTIDAILSCKDGQKIYSEVYNPLMEPVKAYYADLGEKKAVVEMAQASGLTLVPMHNRNIMRASTYGTGQLIKHAIKSGFTDITVAIGGSATNDGGIGCIQALGGKFFDSCGNILQGNGENLERIARIDVPEISELLTKVNFTVMCDVTTPLCGENGATYTFGKQKGASEQELYNLEKGMQNYRHVIINQFGTDPDDIAGSGAAGGLGTALSIILRAKIKSGIDTLLDLIDFENLIKNTNYIITGEGRLDNQSLLGKVIYGIGKRAEKYNVPVIALCGCLGGGYEDIYNFGIKKVYPVATNEKEIEESLKMPKEKYYKAAIKIFNEIKNTVLS